MNPIDIILLFCANFFGALALLCYLKVKRLKKEYKETMQAMKDQSYEIVHELRAPLTAMKDAAALLNESSGSLSPEDQKKMLNLIRSECFRMLEQVTGFLDASKVMNNKLTVQKTPNDLKKLLEEKIIIYTAQAKAAGIDLISDIDQSLPTVMYDPRYMNQVANNLISNSLKYTPQGGSITVSAKNTGTSIVVAIFDNGLGVPTEKQKQLFSKFATLEHKDNTIASTGLGLYVVKGIVEAHGGTISVDSREGRGYKVSFTLPLTSLPASLVQGNQ